MVFDVYTVYTVVGGNKLFEDKQTGSQPEGVGKEKTEEILFM